METLGSLLRGLIFPYLGWLGYKNRAGLKETVRNEANEIVRDPHVREAGNILLGHYHASRRQLKRAKWLSIVAIVGCCLLAMVSHFVPSLGDAGEIRNWGEVAIVPLVALVGLILMYLAAKIVIIEGLLAFILATARFGWHKAVDLLPSFIGRPIRGVADDLALPCIKMADMLRDLALSIVMGFVSLALFLIVFKIDLEIKGSAVVVLSVIGIVAAVLHAKRETKWLRPVTLAMSIIALVVTASVSVARASVTVADIRQECIAQYYKFGTPKDAKQVTLCKANVEAEMMLNLEAFVDLKGKKLTAAQIAEWNARATVILAALEEKPKPEDKPKPLDWSAPSVASAPSPVNMVMATGTSTKPKPAKPSAASVQKAAEKARMQERQRKINDLLGNKQ